MTIYKSALTFRGENINRRSGKIKTRVFALLLMIMSCGIGISAFRSLGREFSGFLIRKTFATGATTNQYWLFLLPQSELASNSGEAAVLSTMTPDQQAEYEGDLQRVGVSAIVYNEARPLNRIEKGSFSPYISVENQTYIDLGLNWLLFALAGLALSIWMYFQTLKKIPGETDSEDIEI